MHHAHVVQHEQIAARPLTAPQLAIFGAPPRRFLLFGELSPVAPFERVGLVLESELTVRLPKPVKGRGQVRVA